MERIKYILLTILSLSSLVLSNCSKQTISNIDDNSLLSTNTSFNIFDERIYGIYELYLANGGTLSYEEWLNSIKGSDGKDGLTPYIGENGNWWIGENDIGVCAQGPAGKDSSDVLPSYWLSYMEEKIVSIRQKDMLICNNGDSFIFVTDTHVRRNAMNSPNLFRYIYEHSAVQKLINGGDVIEYDMEKSEAISILQDWKTAVYGLDEIEIKGNHDSNNNDGQNKENSISDAEWWGIMLRPLTNKYDLTKELHYVADNRIQKIRYIILNSESSNYSLELDYLEEKLTQLDDGWTSLIIQHRFYESETRAVGRIGTLLVNRLNSIYSSLKCSFAGILVGHAHADLETFDSVYGYPIIGVCGDTISAESSNYKRTIDSVSEQCFDVVHIDLSNRKLFFTRIGAGDTSVGNGTGVREFAF